MSYVREKDIKDLFNSKMFVEQLKLEITLLLPSEKENFEQLVYDSIKFTNIKESTDYSWSAINKIVKKSPGVKPTSMKDFGWAFTNSSIEDMIDYYKIYLIKQFKEYTLHPEDGGQIEDYTNDIHHLYAFNEYEDRLYFLKSLAIDPTQYVYLTYLVKPGEEIPNLENITRLWNVKDYKNMDITRLKVIKWTDMIDSKPIQHEINNWVKVIEVGVDHPGINDTFTFWDFKVLTMDALRPITEKEDDWITVGNKFLDILVKLHSIGCHSDIKPDNIMKSLDGKKYYLIDMDGITTTREHYGFHRNTWSPLYASQVFDSNIITTPKYDLIELGYTLNIIFEGIKNKEEYRYFGKKSKMFMYSKVINSYPENAITLDTYQKLRNTLKENYWEDNQKWLIETDYLNYKR